MKWIAYNIGGDWWLCVKTPSGKVIPIMRKGRVGDCIRF